MWGLKNVEITPVINFVVGSLNERPTLSSPSIRLIPPKMIVSVEECRSNALNQKIVNSVYFANFSCPIRVYMKLHVIQISMTGDGGSM